ncbi:MAG: hypothetical protein ABFD07_00100 [Methanobacterium sp.]
MNINEENKDLDKKGTFIPIPEEFKKFFKGDKLSYTNLTTKKDRLEKNENITPDEKKLLDWINKKLKSEIAKDRGPKAARMHIEAEGSKQGKDGANNFKNRQSTEVGGVGHVLKIKESEINKEIDSIKYLIEYMNNNKNKI